MLGCVLVTKDTRMCVCVLHTKARCWLPPRSKEGSFVTFQSVAQKSGKKLAQVRLPACLLGGGGGAGR